MSKEFNLSEKIEIDFVNGRNKEVVELKDVKEFIRRLKEDVNITCQLHNIEADEIYVRIITYIDMLAGAKLK